MDFLVEVRRRVRRYQRPGSVNHAVATLVEISVQPDPQGEAARRVLRALIHPERDSQFTLRDLITLGPLGLAALDFLVEAIFDNRYSPEDLGRAMASIQAPRPVDNFLPAE
jgi:hypothetical protein